MIGTLINRFGKRYQNFPQFDFKFGTVCVPSYANLFMLQFEEKHVYPYIKDMTLLYFRYIDDLLTIWKGTKEQLITFINELNRKHKTIKFEYEISSQKIPFLDTMVDKDKENHAKSERPSGLKNSIIYSQTLRLKTIRSAEDKYQRNCAVIKQKLVERKCIN